jgi:GntR family transcriptional repressor for pyruvate dehydrogenase complex
VADQIGEMIRAGEFDPGHRLPAERDLSKMLGVSRPVVREAMIALEIAGLVEVRTGSGAYVRDHKAVQGWQIDAGHSPTDIISARMMIEGEIAALAAARASDRAIKDIGALVDLMVREHEEGLPGMESDLRFHSAIAQATGNAVLASTVERLWQEQHAPVFSILSDRVNLTANWEATIQGHREIFDAIRLRDPQAALRAMRGHLAQVLEVLNGEG